MEPTIISVAEKRLIGKSLRLTFGDYRIHELWQAFMPKRREILAPLTRDLVSMGIYSPAFDFTNIDPLAKFERWAATEVANFEQIPDGLETYTLPSGTYAVFHYKGLSTDTRIFEYIFRSWLPNSQYALDNRPHFEILGERYKNNDPNSEEDIYIPVKKEM